MSVIMRPDPYATTNKNEQICISKGFSNEQKRTIVRLPFLEWILVETPTKQRRMSKSEQAIFKGDSIRNEHEKGTCKQNRTSSSQGDFQTNKNEQLFVCHSQGGF